MKNLAFNLISYINYRLHCRGSRWLHAPFFYQLFNRIKSDSEFHSILDFQHSLLKELKTNSTILSYKDVGAGSRLSPKTRTVRSLATTSLTPRAELRKILILTEVIRPDYFVELGTCLGATSLCMNRAFPKLPIITMEGAPPIAAFARQQFSQKGSATILLKEGLFKDQLPAVLQEWQHQGKGLFLIDGHHAYQSTLDYAEMIFEKATQGSVLIFDDIHWSPDMYKAWQDIKSHPQSVATITWFRSGWVFTDPELTPGHYTWLG